METLIILNTILADNPQVRALALLVAANLVVALIAALRSRNFRLSRVGDFVWVRLIPLMLGYIAVALVALASPDLAPIRDATWAALMATGIGNVLRSLGELGVPVPGPLK